jgi:hypothetical protein
MSGGIYHFKEIIAAKRNQKNSVSKYKARLQKVKQHIKILKPIIKEQ